MENGQGHMTCITGITCMAPMTQACLQLQYAAQSGDNSTRTICEALETSRRQSEFETLKLTQRGALSNVLHVRISYTARSYLVHTGTCVRVAGGTFSLASFVSVKACV